MEKPTRRDKRRMLWLKDVILREYPTDNSLIAAEIWKSCQSLLYNDATQLRNKKPLKKRRIIEEDEEDDQRD